MNKNIEIFDQNKSDLQDIVFQFKDLNINGIEDKEGYDQVNNAIKCIKKIISKIKKTGKEGRDEAIKYQKGVIAMEKDLISVVEPVMLDLKKKKEEIDLKVEIENRRFSLGERRNKLSLLDIKISDDDILLMDDMQFDQFYNSECAKLLEKKKIEERDELRKKEIEDAKKKAEQDAILEIERKKKLEEFERKKKQDEMLRNKKVSEFLSTLGYNESNKSDYNICWEGEDHLIVYKKLGELNLKG